MEWLADPRWTGIGTLTGILALIIAIIASRDSFTLLFQSFVKNGPQPDATAPKEESQFRVPRWRGKLWHHGSVMMSAGLFTVIFSWSAYDPQASSSDFLQFIGSTILLFYLLVHTELNLCHILSGGLGDSLAIWYFAIVAGTQLLVSYIGTHLGEPNLSFVTTKHFLIASNARHVGEVYPMPPNLWAITPTLLMPGLIANWLFWQFLTNYNRRVTTSR